MEANRFLKAFKGLNRFDNKKNINNSLVFLFITSLLLIVPQLSQVSEIYLNNPIFYLIAPIGIVFFVFILSVISAFIIQYSWIRTKINYTYALQFSVFIFFILSCSQTIRIIFEHLLNMNKDQSLIIGLSSFVLLLLVFSYIVSFYTVEKEFIEYKTSKEEEDNDDFIEFNEESIEEEPKDSFSYVRKMLMSILGNFFRAFLIMIFATYMISGVTIFLQ